LFYHVTGRCSCRAALRAGFTIMELMLAIAVAAVLAAVALPRVRGAAARQAVEGARAHVTGQVIRARAAANERRCAAVVHVTPGSTARVWVTACARGANAVDTIASVAYLSERPVYPRGRRS
jgi:prepilin-type N-terminal cleavage/methylation domain-containing protein